MPSNTTSLFTRFIPAGSVGLALLTLGSYVLGLLRDRTFARTFGASAELDAYNAAFLLPDFLFNFLVASGIAAAVVPIFLGLWKKDHRQAQEYLNTVLSVGSAVMGAVALILIVFAPFFSKLVAPGFDGEERELLASLLRLLALSPIIFSASNALGAVLVARKQFLFYGLSPILYNLGIISGALFLSPALGIRGVAIGTLIGACLHLLARVYDARDLLRNFRVSFAWKTSEFRKTIALMIPKMAGHPVELATFWGFTVIASGLASGSIAILNFARNFQSVPVSIIGIVLATTTFPVLAEALGEKNFGRFHQRLKHSFWLILLASMLAAVFVFFSSRILVSILLGGEAFGPEAVGRTAAVLSMFAFSIPTEALGHLFSRAFYAAKNTLIPVLSSVLSLIISVGLAWFLVSRLGLVSLPLAFFAASLARLVLLMVLLPRFVSRQ